MKDPTDSGADSEFEFRAKRAFDDSVNGIDASIRSRLTQARYAALARAERSTGTVTGNVRRYWLPAAGLTAAAVFAALVILPHLNSNAPIAAATFADDMPMLLESDSVELVEDMEFYAWLDDDTLDSDAHDDAINDDASGAAAASARS